MTRNEIIFSMFYTQYNILRGNIEQIQQNLRYREVHTTDCLELIIAKEKFEYLREMSKWIFSVLKIDEDEYFEKLFDDFKKEQKKREMF